MSRAGDCRRQTPILEAPGRVPAFILHQEVQSVLCAKPIQWNQGGVPFP